MAVIEKLKDINQRVALIIKQQTQLKTQAQNWEKSYREATEVQKKLIEQSTDNAKQNDALNHEITKLKTGIADWKQKHQQLNEKQNHLVSENESLNRKVQTITGELQAMRLKEEQQLSMHFGVEKEQEQLKAISEDLKEQLNASQLLNAELQTELQSAKITLVEEQAQANSVLNQKNNLEKEVVQLKEKYQSDLSELHSKNSFNESQTEKLSAESKKLRENVTELTQSNNEKERTIEKLKTRTEEMGTQITLDHDSSFLVSRIAKLTSQIENLQFEKELLKKTRIQPEHTQPSKIAEIVNQSPGSNDEQIHFLYSELQASQSANSELEKQINNYIEILSGQAKKTGSEPGQLINLPEQNKIVKLAQAIEGNTVASNIELKQKLNEMIKEVDRCIAKLSS